MHVNGNEIAGALYGEMQEIVAACERAPRLGVVVCGANAVTESFIAIKKRAALRLGIELVRVDIPETATVDEIRTHIQELAERIEGIIVQLPLPRGIEVDQVLACIPANKDVDGIRPGGTMVRAPVASAIAEILRVHDVHISGKQAVVIGSGRLVGKPAAEMLADAGANVEVLTEADSLERVRDADILVLGAGKPGIVTPDMLKEGVVIVDAGTSEEGGRVRGDADPACAEVASVFTPVPGGVGPIAVAMIFKNLLILAGCIKEGQE